LGACDVCTGSVFKYLIGAAIDPKYVFDGFVPTLYLGDDALRYAWESGAILRGTEVYETRFKPQVGGFDICMFPESGQRCIDPDGPAILAAKLIRFVPGCTVTDVINAQECSALCKNLEDLDIPYVIVRLDCENPVARNGDNRRLLSEDECWLSGIHGPLEVISLEYSLEDLDNLVPTLVNRLLKTIQD
jgi:hypothetical protein